MIPKPLHSYSSDLDNRIGGMLANELRKPSLKEQFRDIVKRNKGSQDSAIDSKQRNGSY